MSMRMFLAFFCAALGPTAIDALVRGPWSDTTATPDARARALLANMTLDEKISMLHGPARYPPHLRPNGRSDMMNPGVQKPHCDP